MAERKTETAAAEPDFLQFNDLACEVVGGRVSHCELVLWNHMFNTIRDERDRNLTAQEGLRASPAQVGSL